MYIFQSAGENTQHCKKILRGGSKNVLVSYYYIRKKRQAGLYILDNWEPGIKVMVDSGAHTIQKEDLSGGNLNKQKEFYSRYCEEYLDWVKRHEDKLFSCVELDVEESTSLELVRYLQERYFEPFSKESKVKVIFVWHKERGLAGWADMCKKYTHVGIAAETASRSHQFVHTASQFKAKVHGFAMTKPDILKKVPFYSVDSSVTGDSSILVRSNGGQTERLSIAELYARFQEKEIRTTPTETIVPISGMKTLSCDNYNEVVWGNLYGVAKHTVKKKLLRVTTEGGKQITCTSDHSLIVMDRRGNLREASAEALSAGDFLLSPMQWNNEALPEARNIDCHGTKHHLSIRKNQLPINENLLEFLGLWMGDGSISKGGQIRLACYNDPECARVVRGLGYHVTPCPNGVDCGISNTELANTMQYLGFTGDSHTKRVPKFVYSLHRDLIAAFLRGYFSADGSIGARGSRNNLDCSTVSPELRSDIVELLCLFGIHATVSVYPAHRFIKGGKTYTAAASYRLTVSDKRSKEVFYDRIGFLQAYKQDKLRRSIEMTKGGNGITHSRKIDIPVSLLKRAGYRRAGVSAIWRPLTSRDKKAIRGVGNFEPKVELSDLLFLTIKKVEVVSEQKEVEVYDLCVRKYERFFANGLLAHNTRWCMGEQYGCTFIWHVNRMIEFLKTDKNQRKRFKRYYEKLGLDFEKILADDNFELSSANVAAWVQCEAYCTKVLGAKQWWLKDGKDIERDYEPTEGGILVRKKKLFSLGGHVIGKKPEVPAGVVSEEAPPEEKPREEVESPAEVVETESNNTQLPAVPLDDSQRLAAAEAKKKKSVDAALTCDLCQAKDSCPHAKDACVCALQDVFKRFPSRNQYDVAAKVAELVGIQEERTFRNLYMEKLDGGVADKNVSSLLGQLLDMYSTQQSILKELNGPGPTGEESMTVRGGKGLLEKIFGGGEEETIVDMAPEKPTAEEPASQEQANSNTFVPSSIIRKEKSGMSLFLKKRLAEKKQEGQQ